MAFHSDFRGGKSRIVSTPTEPIYVKIMVPSCAVRELYRLT